MDRAGALLSLVPTAPDFSVDFAGIERAFPAVVADMRATPQNPKYHAEGDVWAHTAMVCECIARDPDFRACPERVRQELFLSALFHDIGKTRTTKLENGEWTSPNHAVVGACMVRDMLTREYGLSGSAERQAFRETVCFLIRYHMVAPYIMESQKPDRKLIRLASNGELAADFTLSRLLILARADGNGKISESGGEGEESVMLAAELSKELGCFEAPVRFASPFTAYAFFAGRNVTPDTPLYNDTVCEAILMCGLPGVGKDAYIRAHYPDLPMISLDDIRAEYGISPVGDQSEVARIAKARAKTLLRAKRSFVWNATNVTAKLRGELISLFTGYHAYVKIVYLETDYARDLERNAAREAAVPQAVIETMLSKLIPPERHEAHEVEWKLV
ncbi:MAG: AAA family ATPase [Ruminococcus sp.]|nr:AAA family ATPase [Ruminococcus sp.]